MFLVLGVYITTVVRPSIMGRFQARLTQCPLPRERCLLDTPSHWPAIQCLRPGIPRRRLRNPVSAGNAAPERSVYVIGFLTARDIAVWVYIEAGSFVSRWQNSNSSSLFVNHVGWEQKSCI